MFPGNDHTSSSQGMGHQESITGGLRSELSDDSVGFLQSHNTETMQYCNTCESSMNLQQVQALATHV